MERVVKDKLRLGGKDEDKRQEEPRHGHVIKLRKKDCFKIILPFSPSHHPARQHTDHKGNEDKKNNTEKKRSIRNNHL